MRRVAAGLIGELALDVLRRHAFLHVRVFDELPGLSGVFVAQIGIVYFIHVYGAAGGGKQADEAAVVAVEVGQKQVRPAQVDVQLAQAAAQGRLAFGPVEPRVDDQVARRPLDDVRVEVFQGVVRQIYVNLVDVGVVVQLLDHADSLLRSK